MTREDARLVIMTDIVLCDEIKGGYMSAVDVLIKDSIKITKIEQIIDDCDLETWEILGMIKEVLEQE